MSNRKSNRSTGENHRSNNNGQSREERAMECCQKWLAAIELASVVLMRSRQERPTNREEGQQLVASLDRSIDYLGTLERKLNSLEEHWDQPPLKLPPKYFRPRHQQGREYEASQNGVSMAMNTSPLVMRRLLIRVVTAQSDLYACKACQFRHSKQWKLGADLYALGLDRIYFALNLADSEFARLFLEEGDSSNNVDAASFAEDADIVQVSIQHLVEERGRFQKAAEQQLRKLRQRLEPQWMDRDAVRARIGEDKWFSNPNPKREFAQKRKVDETELKELEEALDALDRMVLPDFDAAKRYKAPPRKNGNTNRRYNGQRPLDFSRRVSLQEYPDPTFYGWTFTGSFNNYVEFFETSTADGTIKMDWYFTTGTIKTSLNHPTQGKTQLFRAKVSSEVYLRVLQEPRAHTNVGYQTRRGRGAAANAEIP